jgi:hypothetical protein
MTNLTPLLIAPAMLAGLIVPGFASATGPDGGPAAGRSQPRCMAPPEFIRTVATAGDWVIGQSPTHAPAERVTGVVFRESGMIDVALFRNGCLAAVIIVGKAAPDTIV